MIDILLLAEMLIQCISTKRIHLKTVYGQKISVGEITCVLNRRCEIFLYSKRSGDAKKLNPRYIHNHERSSIFS